MPFHIEGTPHHANHTAATVSLRALCADTVCLKHSSLYTMDWIQSIIEGSPVVQGGLTLMIAGWLGYQLRALPDRFFSLTRGIFTRVIEIREKHPLYDAWLGLLTEHARRPGGPRTLEVRSTTDDYEERAAASAFAAGSDSFWARVHGKWCRVSIRREEAAGGGGADLVRRFIIRVEVLFATPADLARMLSATKQRANVMEDRQRVDLCGKYGTSSTITLPLREPETLCFPPSFFEDFASRVRDFSESRDDYERLGIPWRLGILLHGKPGTGKTSISHALASVLKRRLAVIPLADMRSDEDLFSAFEGVRDGSIVLIEDVDCAFNKRSSEDAEGITFSGFLNCIDGVIAPQNGRVLIMSTNHIERLDPALIRPGRADLRIEVPLLQKDVAMDYVDRLFAHVPNRHEIVHEVMEGAHPTSAVLINRIMREDWRRPARSTVASRDGASAPAPKQRRRVGVWR